jgi:arginyl-tRNA synthetase
MLDSLIRDLLITAWRKLELSPLTTSPEVQVPERPEFGDFSSNLPLAAAKEANLRPRDLAERLKRVLAQSRETFRDVAVAGPGFLNFFLTPSIIQTALRAVLESGDRFGRSSTGGEGKLQVEFVSSNPTGPLTVGHGRQAVLGDVLASLYEALGYNVTREYYFNDEGHQIDLLAESLWARYRQVLGEDVPIPENGYHGDYLVDIARELAKRVRDSLNTFNVEIAQLLKEEAVSRISASIKKDLASLGVHFDTWFSERTLHESGEVDAALEELQRRNGVYEKDGAVWLRAEEHGGAKDSVLTRSDGRPTYLMVDIAYHINKHIRNFDWVIDVQGADHHAEQSCVKAAMRILGYPEGFLTYAVHQFVSIKAEDKAARMSTRAGRFILLHDLIEELGRDVVRYFLIARKPESHLEFDLELARAESMDNPVYYIQYAHTRIASIFRKAKPQPTPLETVDLFPLQNQPELDLIKRLDRFPEMIETATRSFAPHLLADYTLDLARAFHAYYTEYRVLGEEEATTLARLALLKAIQTVFRRGLTILGMSIPETM